MKLPIKKYSFYPWNKIDLLNIRTINLWRLLKTILIGFNLHSGTNFQILINGMGFLLTYILAGFYTYNYSDNIAIPF